MTTGSPSLPVRQTTGYDQLMSCSRAAARCLAGAFVLAGCGPGGAGGSAAADAGGVVPQVVLGTGLQAYEPLASESTVPLIHGIQGAFHVWTSFLAYGFDADVVHMRISTRWELLDTSFLEAEGIVGLRDAMDAEGAPASTMHGWPALVFDPGCRNGQRLDVNVTVSDDTGHAASDARTWIVEVAEADRSPDCPP